MAFRVEITSDHIALFDGEEELIYWDQEEWREDPSVVPPIAAAITLGFTEGPDAVRSLKMGGDS